MVSVGLLVVALNMIDLVFLSPGLFGGKTGALAAIVILHKGVEIVSGSEHPFLLMKKTGRRYSPPLWESKAQMEAGR